MNSQIWWHIIRWWEGEKLNLRSMNLLPDDFYEAEKKFLEIYPFYAPNNGMIRRAKPLNWVYPIFALS